MLLDTLPMGRLNRPPPLLPATIMLAPMYVCSATSPITLLLPRSLRKPSPGFHHSCLDSIGSELALPEQNDPFA